MVDVISPSLTMSAVSRRFRAHGGIRSDLSAISLSLKFARPTLGSLVIVRVRNSVRPNHLFDRNCDHDYFFELPGEGERDAQSITSMFDCTPWRVPSLSRVSVWACGPLNLMKIIPNRMQNRTGSERRD